MLQLAAPLAQKPLMHLLCDRADDISPATANVPTQGSTKSAIASARVGHDLISVRS